MDKTNSRDIAIAPAVFQKEHYAIIPITAANRVGNKEPDSRMLPTFANKLPKSLAIPLFGDRERYGKTADRNDPEWIEWNARQYDFYLASQRAPVALAISQAGYKIMRQVPLQGARVLEIGPADIRHIHYWNGQPSSFTSVDFRENLLKIAAKRLEQQGVRHQEICVDPDERRLPFDDGSFDVVLSFYALEHFHPLDDHLAELRRVLSSGGVLAGAVPCEGGLAWGLGRLLTTRRWLHRNTSVQMDKIICWEHPNFVDHIMKRLDAHFTARRVRLWPLRIASPDVNLISGFIYEKRE